MAHLSQTWLALDRPSSRGTCSMGCTKFEAIGRPSVTRLHGHHLLGFRVDYQGLCASLPRCTTGSLLRENSTEAWGYHSFRYCFRHCRYWDSVWEVLLLRKTCGLRSGRNANHARLRVLTRPDPAGLRILPADLRSRRIELLPHAQCGLSQPRPLHRHTKSRCRCQDHRLLLRYGTRLFQFHPASRPIFDLSTNWPPQVIRLHQQALSLQMA